jgi:hypothetical protein
MGFRLRPAVEAKDSPDDAGILGGHADGSDAAAEISLGMTIFTQLHMERPLQISHSSRQADRAARKFGAGFSNLETEIPGELPDLFEIGWVGAVRSLEGGARQGLEPRLLESLLQLRLFRL